MLRGGSGDDQLSGGTGSNVLYGGAGADSYFFNAYDGSQVINDPSNAEEDSALDEIVFGAGVAPADLQLSAYSFPDTPSLLIRNTATGDFIEVRGFWSEERGYGNTDRIESIRFADGTVWDLAEIRSRGRQVIGTSGNDWILYGLEGGSKIYGLAGNDEMRGNDGDDFMDGGSGADLMSGGAGNDIYIVDDPGDVVQEPTEGATMKFWRR